MDQQKSQMNTLCISFPYDYAVEAANLNWFDVLFAIENGFLCHKSAIIYASDALEKDTETPQAVLDLAILSDDEAKFPHSIYPYINELANQVSDEEKSKTKDKIMYILLKWVYEHRSDYPDPLEVVEFIYDDFGFPESITGFIRYLPMNGPDLGSFEKNVARLFEYWKQFLNEKKLLYKKT